MSVLDDIRQAYPEYADWTDQDLSNGLYKKYGEGVDREEFETQLGIRKPRRDTFSQIYAAGVQGGRRAIQELTAATQSPWSPNVLSPEEAAASIAEREKSTQEYLKRRPKDVEAFEKALQEGHYWDAIKALGSSPVQVLGTMGAEGLGGSIAPLIGKAATTALGGAAGIESGPGALATGAVGAAVGDLPAAAGRVVIDELRKRNVDLTDKNAVQRAFQDPSFVEGLKGKIGSVATEALISGAVFGPMGGMGGVGREILYQTGLGAVAPSARKLVDEGKLATPEETIAGGVTQGIGTLPLVVGSRRVNRRAESPPGGRPPEPTSAPSPQVPGEPPRPWQPGDEITYAPGERSVPDINIPGAGDLVPPHEATPPAPVVEAPRPRSVQTPDIQYTPYEETRHLVPYGTGGDYQFEFSRPAGQLRPTYEGIPTVPGLQGIADFGALTRPEAAPPAGSIPPARIAPDFPAAEPIPPRPPNPMEPFRPVVERLAERGGNINDIRSALGSDMPTARNVAKQMMEQGGLEKWGNQYRLTDRARDILREEARPEEAAPAKPSLPAGLTDMAGNEIKTIGDVAAAHKELASQQKKLEGLIKNPGKLAAIMKKNGMVVSPDTIERARADNIAQALENQKRLDAYQDVLKANPLIKQEIIGNSSIAGEPKYSMFGGRFADKADKYIAHRMNLLSDRRGDVGLKSLLTDIIPEISTPHYRELANNLISRLSDDIKVMENKEATNHMRRQFGDILSSDRYDKMRSAGGFYWGTAVGINKNASNPTAAVLHEAVHAATERFIRRNPEHELTTKLNTLFSRVSDILKTDEDFLARHAGQDSGELLAAAFTDPAVQKILKKTLLPDHVVKEIGLAKKASNAWDAFIDLIRRVIGLSPNNHALGHVLDIGGAIMDRNVAAWKDFHEPKLSVQQTPLSDTLGKAWDRAVHDKDVLWSERAHNWAQPNWWKNSLRGLYQKVVYANDPVARNEAAAVLNRPDEITQLFGGAYVSDRYNRLGAEFSPTVAMDMANRASFVNVTAFTEGVPVLKEAQAGNKMSAYTMVEKTKEPPAKAFKEIIEKGLGKQFYLYSISQRIGRLSEEKGLKFPLSDAEVTEAKRLGDQHPEIKEAYKKYQDWNRSVMDFAADTGVISKEFKDELTKAMDYYGLYRRVEVDPNAFRKKGGVGSAIRIIPVEGGFKPLDGDWMKTALRNSGFWIDAGMRNIAAMKALKMAEWDGSAVPGKVHALEKSAAIKKGEGTLFSEGKTVRYYENGKPKEFALLDPFWQDMMGSFDHLAIGDGIQLLAKPANWLRMAVTRDPGFIVANMMRDTLASWVSRNENYVPFKDTIKGFIASAKRTPTHEELLRMGVIGNYDLAVQSYENAAKLVGREIARESTKGKIYAFKNIKDFPMAVWDWAGRMSEHSDASTRIAVAEAAKKEGASEYEAGIRALNTLNFSRHGSNKYVRLMNVLWPFLNARIQGFDVLGRGGPSQIVKRLSGEALSKQDSQMMGRFMVRGGLMASTALALQALNQDDPEYQQIPDYRRDGNLMVPLKLFGFDGGYLAIPKPFEQGVMFMTTPEHVSSYLQGTESGKKAAFAVGQQVLQSIALMPLPQAVLPAVETTANYSFYTRRPIVGQKYEGMDVERQFDQRTSELSKTVAPALGYSPLKMDYLIRGYTGALGSYLADAASYLLKETKGGPTPPEWSVSNLPMVKRFLVDKQNSYPQAVADWYELDNAVKTATTTLNSYKQAGDIEGYKDYLARNSALLAVKTPVHAVTTQLRKLRQAEETIYSSPTMNGQQKREALDRIREAMVGLTKNYNEINRLAGR